MKPLLVLYVSMFALIGLFITPGVHAQSFSVVSTVNPDGASYDYSFKVNYDQAGVVQTLSAPIFDWSFYIDPTGLAPTNIQSPTGWQTSYDPSSGAFDWYTEGPNGFGNGDFGPNVIQPGGSLSGFSFTSADTPGLSIAFATDEAFNQDANSAVLPTTAPTAAPEVATFAGFTLSFGVLGLCTFLLRASSRDGKNRPVSIIATVYKFYRQHAADSIE